nr:PREDICTED: RNA polymerase I-specific transcription initiation factor RRN3 [Bemisia tabaci]
MSILKNTSKEGGPSILQPPLKPRKSLRNQEISQERFQNLRALLLQKDVKAYEELVCYVRDAGTAIKDTELVQLLHGARDCISMLNENLRLFVQVLLILKWTHRSEAVVEAYQAFLIDLCLAHSYYLNFALDQLVATFCRVDNVSDWLDGQPSEEEEKEFQNVHKVLKTFIELVPMSPKLLLKCIRKQFPYHNKSRATYVCYFHNILEISEYAPIIRSEILLLIIQKLIILDSLASRKEIINSEEVSMDVEEEQFSLELDAKAKTDLTMKLDAADKLDACLNRFYEYIHNMCHKDGKLQPDITKTLYQELFDIFKQVILPTHGTCHLQFIMFYLLSFKHSLVETFLNALWKEISSPGVPPVIKQAAVGYIASLLARGSFVKMSLLQAMLSEWAGWIHSYISNMDSYEKNMVGQKRHLVFYAICQALFYVVAFRHSDLVNNKKNITFLQNLNLAKIVTCRLNPLCVISPAVVNNFACVTRAYQLAYCYSIIEHNTRYVLPNFSKDEGFGDGVALSTTSRVSLESFFPFDPYLLKRSKVKIDPIYNEYDSGLLNEKGVSIKKEESSPSPEEDDENDFLMDIDSHTPQSSNYAKFNYGTSPGFKNHKV